MLVNYSFLTYYSLSLSILPALDVRLNQKFRNEDSVRIMTDRDFNIKYEYIDIILYRYNKTPTHDIIYIYIYYYTILPISLYGDFNIEFVVLFKLLAIPPALVFLGGLISGNIFVLLLLVLAFLAVLIAFFDSIIASAFLAAIREFLSVIYILCFIPI